MTTPLLIVPATKIAVRLGLTDLMPAQAERVTDAILDAQADVEAELNRPLFAESKSLTGIYPVRGFDLNSYRAWPDGLQFDDDFEPVTRVANPDGSFDVTFSVGLDGPNTAAIVRFVTAHTVQSIMNDANSGMGRRQVTSVSAEGQSVSYSTASSEKGTAGSLPNISTLSAYKRRSVFSRDRSPNALWPNYGSYSS